MSATYDHQGAEMLKQTAIRIQAVTKMCFAVWDQIQKIALLLFLMLLTQFNY